MANNGQSRAAGAVDSMEREKKQIGVRLSAEALRLRGTLSNKLGIDGTAVIELAIRALAKQEGVQ